VSYFMVDVETDGPFPGTLDYSMIMLGCVLVRPDGVKTPGESRSLRAAPTFYGELCPVSQSYDPEYLGVVGVARSQTLAFAKPEETMRKFVEWVGENTVGRPMFVSDNNGFDFCFVAWYCHHFAGHNPFGHSSTNLGSLYKGLVKSTFENFKHLRVTKHTHNPVDDAMGNAEALLYMHDVLGLKINLE
jgi:hypothetical protein